MNIVKYRLVVSGNSFIVKIPSVMVPISVQLDYKTPYLHAIVDMGTEELDYQFFCVCTGEKLPDNFDISRCVYLGTV